MKIVIIPTGDVSQEVLSWAIKKANEVAEHLETTGQCEVDEVEQQQDDQNEQEERAEGIELELESVAEIFMRGIDGENAVEVILADDQSPSMLGHPQMWGHQWILFVAHDSMYLVPGNGILLPVPRLEVLNADSNEESHSGDGGYL